MVHIPIASPTSIATSVLGRGFAPTRARALPVGGRGKRIADVAIATASLVVLSPLLIVIAVLVRLTSDGPIFFSQWRVGHDRRLFRCYKFRTMVPDAEERLERHLRQDADAAREWAATRKLKCDPRITWIGSALRKSSLDELPQLVNVLRGEMSCVGPRPVVPSELEIYGRHAREYLQAKPGLTGMWQVSGRSSVSYRRRVAMDRIYVRRWSWWLEASILLRTVVILANFDDAA